MPDWPDRRLLQLLNIAIPIIQAPMAGSDSVALARSVSSTGALGSLACALLTPDDIRESMRTLRDGLARPFNLNFFCHAMEAPDAAVLERWKNFLRTHFENWHLNIDAVPEARLRTPFDAESCAVVEDVKPEIVSFHFGLPAAHLVERLKKRGIRILSSATSVREAEWLESRGCDAIIAQGFEAGGHRGMFLETDTATQAGLFAAPSGRCGIRARDRGGWNCGCSRYSSRVCTWRIRRAIGHGLSVMPGVPCLSAFSSRPGAGRRQRDRSDEPF